MSKSVTKVPNGNSNHVSKVTKPAPAVREVQPVQLNAHQNETNNFIAVYKDLNQPLKDLASQQKRNLFIGFVVFLILGIGIMMGQSIGKPRNIATANMANLIPKGANATSSEHEHFDKVCYKGENGEQVCMTRTSEKR